MILEAEKTHSRCVVAHQMRKSEDAGDAYETAIEWWRVQKQEFKTMIA